ncbi:unnamed protein product [Ambrosiozyma monospora]|uniref:Unnamed protein product n=1 Tax=Ambrosiozyma monospora TaxID=43982 RepID=A0A9W6Z199_AMBMO|nr:unnamed protein product [Ambrosiozyma monospora]
MVARLFATTSRAALKAVKANMALNRGLATAAPSSGKVRYVPLNSQFTKWLSFTPTFQSMVRYSIESHNSRRSLRIAHIGLLGVECALKKSPTDQRILLHISVFKTVDNFKDLMTQ